MDEIKLGTGVTDFSEHMTRRLLVTAKYTLHRTDYT